MHLLIIQDEMHLIGQLRKESNQAGYRIEWVNHLNTPLLASTHCELLDNARGPIPIMSAKALWVYLHTACSKHAEITVFVAQDIDLSRVKNLQVVEASEVNFSLKLT